MVGLVILVFIKTSLKPRISKIQDDLIKTGIGSLKLGNKGAVGIKFDIDNTTLCFINCHLESGQNAYRERINNLNEIHKKMFALEKSQLEELQSSLLRFPYIFLFGDLNFRINGTNSEVRKKINSFKQYSKSLDGEDKAAAILKELLIDDQGQTIKMHSKYLNYYKEGQITFLPTYKFDPFSEIYDTSKKQRCPAW